MAMWWRLAFPLVFTLAPRLIPRLTRTAYVVWKLILDNRVPLLLRLLVPATLVYFILPISRLAYIGPAAYLVLLSFAIFLLLNFAPQDVVEGYAPWRARRSTKDSRNNDSSRVVEGRYHVVDDEESTK